MSFAGRHHHCHSFVRTCSASAAHDPFRQDKSCTQPKIRVTVFTSFGPVELMNRDEQVLIESLCE